MAKIVLALHVEEPLRINAEILTEAQRDIGRDTLAPATDLVDAAPR